MKRILIFALALVLTSTASFAQKGKGKKATSVKKPVATATKVAVEKVQGPDMTFESTIVDFGSIENDSDPFRYAKFVNNGTEPLIIKQATGSCGCTVPTFPDKPVLPGETGEIKVRYDTKRPGPINKTVTITTNIEGKSIVLQVKGDVKPKASDASVPAGTKNMLNKG